ncbi:oxidoreductase HTATIP2-like [Rhopilema esculentum]|uniref:oxidoreductase HTATIP2-like n=1 Tax=Rhopilema esculentum TaxID=499914 RepID=UPI0031D30416|eukprot:gene5940-11288_t
MAESSGEKGAEAASSSDVKSQEEQTTVPNQFKAIVLGGTGATGRYLVGELLKSKNFKEITLLGRKKLEEVPTCFEIDLEREESSGHLKQIIVDLEQANEENSLKYFEGIDAYFTCFGTTRASAGGNANFQHIDHGYNVKFAEMAKKAGIRFCSLLSSSGAHPRSYVFYLKVKGQIEEEFSKMAFPLLTIFRPGILDRKQHQRLLEKFVGLFMTKMPVDTLAKAIVADAINQLQKEKTEEAYSHILANHQILDLAKAYLKEEQGDSVAATAETPVEEKPTEGEAEAPKDAGNEVDKASEESKGAEKGEESKEGVEGAEKSSDAEKTSDVEKSPEVPVEGASA